MLYLRWAGALAIALAATPAVGQTFTETFEGGIPASWTIVDNHVLAPFPPDFSAVPWTTNDLEGLGNYTDGTGLAATASSFNHSGQYDVSLITPTFVITPGDGSTIRYTINYQRVDAFEAFDTNLSINGGPWIPMTHQTSSLGPAYSTGPPKVTVTSSLAFFGATPGDLARVEFRYYTTFLLPMVRNEYVQIDDVRIPTPIPEPGALALAVSALAGIAALKRRRRYRLVT